MPCMKTKRFIANCWKDSGSRGDPVDSFRYRSSYMPPMTTATLSAKVCCSSREKPSRYLVAHVTSWEIIASVSFRSDTMSSVSRRSSGVESRNAKWICPTRYSAW